MPANFIYRFIIFVSGIILFALFLSLWGFYNAIKPPKFISSVTPQNFGLDYQEITITTDDGIDLSGWWIPRPEPTAQTIILLHGYPADKGNILPATKFLALEYNLLLFDFRYLGQSQGAYSTVGAKEQLDLRAALDWLKEDKGIAKVGVWGFSLGGAVALMTATDSPAIEAIVAESSYASLAQMAPQLYQLPILRYPLAWLSGMWARLFLGINIYDISPIKSAATLQLPILIIHSQTDRTIPFSHAEQLQAALKDNAQAEYWFADNLVHGEFGAKYESRILDFFDRNL